MENKKEIIYKDDFIKPDSISEILENDYFNIGYFQDDLVNIISQQSLEILDLFYQVELLNERVLNTSNQFVVLESETEEISNIVLGRDNVYYSDEYVEKVRDLIEGNIVIESKENKAGEVFQGIENVSNAVSFVAKVTGNEGVATTSKVISKTSDLAGKISDKMFEAALLKDEKEEYKNAVELAQELGTTPDTILGLFEKYREKEKMKGNLDEDLEKKKKYRNSIYNDYILYYEEYKNAEIKYKLENNIEKLENLKIKKADFYNSYSSQLKNENAKIKALEEEVEFYDGNFLNEVLYVITDNQVYYDENGYMVPVDNVMYGDIDYNGEDDGDIAKKVEGISFKVSEINSKDYIENGIFEMSLSEEQIQFLLEEILNAIRMINIEPIIEINQEIEEPVSDSEILSAVESYLEEKFNSYLY